MERVFRVAVHYKEDNGYIEYDEAARKVTVMLQDETKVKEVVDFLSTEHEWGIPQHTLHDFRQCLITPINSMEDFKVGLTRLWGKTGVHVDWSRPV